jgi:methionyl-tRNA synthetase
VRPRPIVDVLGMDALRYYLLRETVFGQVGNFSYDALIQRYNSDLANGLGNLASRTAALIEKFFAGTIPKPGALGPQDEALAKETQAAIGEVLENYEALKFSHALEKLWSVISAADKYLTSEKPWAGGTSDAEQQRRGTVLWTTSELLRVVVALAHPVLPDCTAKVWSTLGLPGKISAVDLGALRWGQLAPGTALGKTQALFPRIDKKEAQERMEAMENEEQNAPSPVAAGAPSSAASATVAPTPAAGGAAAAAVSEKIGIEDFTKVEMRVGQIKTAERIVGADKLLKLTVDIGTEIRQICAGIAQFYEPEKLIGRKVAVVVNLAPRKLRGVESNGMIIAAAVGPDGRPVLAGFPDEDVEVGARLR